MLLGLDHLVILVTDLADASRRLSDLGFHVQPGGRHGSGTHNSLVTFEDGCYLEIIAFHSDTPSHRWWALREVGGFIDYCAVTDDLTGDRQEFEAAGIAMTPPYALTRTRPDGVTLSWMVSVPERRGSSLSPFLIRDVTLRNQRIGVPVPHPNGAKRVARIQMIAKSPRRILAWVKALGLRHIRIDSLDGDCETLRVFIGLHEVDYVCLGERRSCLDTPVSECSPPPALGPFGIHIESSRHATPILLPESHTSGARITLVGSNAL